MNTASTVRVRSVPKTVGVIVATVGSLVKSPGVYLRFFGTTFPFLLLAHREGLVVRLLEVALVELSFVGRLALRAVVEQALAVSFHLCLGPVKSFGFSVYPVLSN
jgi:hypothetical protein